MKNLRKDNKGFSLVELIVVVLIMAIIAVALAPQILKWVNNSRISSDLNTADSAVTALQNALTNEKALEAVDSTKYLFITSAGITGGDIAVNTGAVATTDAASVVLNKKFTEYAGITAAADMKTKASKAVIRIKIEPKGKITKEYGTTSDGNVSASSTITSTTVDN